MNIQQMRASLVHYGSLPTQIEGMLFTIDSLNKTNFKSHLGTPDIIIKKQTDAVEEYLYFRKWKPVFLKIRLSDSDIVKDLGLYRGIWVVGHDFCFNFTLPFIIDAKPVTIRRIMVHLQKWYPNIPEEMDIEVHTQREKQRIRWMKGDDANMLQELQEGDEVILSLHENELMSQP